MWIKIRNLILFATILGCENTEFEGACLDAIPQEVHEKIAQQSVAANNARLQSLAAERARVGADPVRLHQNIFYGPRKSDGDPFPNAVPIFLDTASQANHNSNFYSEFHGDEGHRVVYETALGSKQYFIVDEILGDGGGSATLSNPVPGLPNDGSMHSWHATSDNRLVRLRLSPTYSTSESVSICGCGPNDYESGQETLPASAGAPALVVRNLGIFLLPGTHIPSLHSESMNVQFIDESISIRYIPRKGKHCIQKPSPVC